MQYEDRDLILNIVASANIYSVYYVEIGCNVLFLSHKIGWQCNSDA